jgi:hypothetical protein
MSSEIDVSDTCKARSDQLNADDLVGGPITVTITDVARAASDQPIAISITGGHQPFRPCKTMRRALVAAWGANAREWHGRSMTLYRDPNVKWAGDNVGGIRISHMSHITKPLELSLSESKGKKKKIVIQPLRDHVAEWKTRLTDCTTIAALKALGPQISKSGLDATGLATLREFYKVRERELNNPETQDSSPPDSTDLNRQHEPAQAFHQEIAAGLNRTQGADLLNRMDAARKSGEITEAEFTELKTRLNGELE